MKMLKSKGLSALDKLLLCVFGIYFVLIVLFDANSDYIMYSHIGFMAFCGVSVGYLLLTRKKVMVNTFDTMFLITLVFFGVSSVFGMDTDVSAVQLKTLTLVFIMYILMTKSLTYVLDETRLSGIYAISAIALFIWTAYTYGFNEMYEMIASGNESRVGAEVSQENIFGMMAAIIFAGCLYAAIMYKKVLYWIPTIAMIVLIAMSGSRKALLVVPVAFFFILIMKNGFKKSYRTVIIVLIAVPIAIQVLKLPIFEVILDRFDGLFDFMSGKKGDLSSQMRGRMIELGLEWYKSNPFIGYGLDCYKLMSKRYFGGVERYSHNNYIELMVNTGTIGFALYYSLYGYLCVQLARIRKRYNSNFAGLCILLLIVQLITDVGMVSYTYKTTYINFAISMICITQYNSKRREIYER